MAVARKVTVGVFAETAEAQRKLDAIAAEAEALGKLNPEIKPQIDRRAASQSLAVLTGELKAAAREADKTSGSVGGLGKAGAGAAGPLGALAGGPMAALIGAGVALSPVITTLGIGTAGFGLAAAGAVAPVFKVAQATGGLRANMAKLDPEQQKVAQGLLGLGKQYQGFEKALEPTVLADFSGALRIAGHVLKDLEPVSKATGTAIGGLLGAVDKEFASGTWQDFFGFMATTAGPDVQLVSNNLVDLMKVLPPLIEDLQPAAQAVLTLSDDFLKAARAGAGLIGVIELLPPANTKSADSMSNWAESVTNRFIPGARWVNRQLRGVQVAFGDSAAAAAGNAGAMKRAAPPAWTLAAAMGSVTGALDAQLGPLLTSQQDWVTWKQSQQAAKTAIDAVKGSLNGQSKSALAADSQIITSTSNALAFADSQKHTKAGLDAADTVLKNQIGFLKDHAGKSRIAKKEIDLLRAAEAKLHDIRQRLTVTGTGHWSIATLSPGGPGGVPRPLTPAAGMRVPGFGGGDRWPALLEGGEAVVDKDRTAALAPLFKAIGVPGFAAGGIAGSFAGSPSGLGKWLLSEDRATLRALETSVARATFAGLRGAMAGAGGSGALGGDAAANMALARRMFPFSAGQWAPFVALTMAESGFNRFARNPASGAYGIPQALPPTKMPFAAQAAGGSHAGPQLGWMFSYIASRWGSPANAEANELRNHWYDSGTQYLPPGGPWLAWNGTGRPERVGGEELAPLLRDVKGLLQQLVGISQKAPSVQAAQTARLLSGRPAAPRPSVFASR